MNELEAQLKGMEVVAYDLDSTLQLENRFFIDSVKPRDPGFLPIADPDKIIWNLLIEDKRKDRFIIVYTVRLNERLWGAKNVKKQRKIIESWLTKHGYHQYVDEIIGDLPLATRNINDRKLILTETKGSDLISTEDIKPDSTEETNLSSEEKSMADEFKVSVAKIERLYEEIVTLIKRVKRIHKIEDISDAKGREAHAKFVEAIVYSDDEQGACEASNNILIMPIDKKELS